VELFAVLVGVAVAVRVAIDSLERPLDILELHLLLLVILGGNLLLAFLLPGRRVVTTRLPLLLLMKLLHEILDLPALIHAVVPGVVYRAPRTTLIIVKGLPRPLVSR
jgi:hypothetical protein